MLLKVLLFTQFLGNFELFLRAVDKTVEFKTELEQIALVTEIEFDGATQLRDITILVN